MKHTCLCLPSPSTDHRGIEGWVGCDNGLLNIRCLWLIFRSTASWPLESASDEKQGWRYIRIQQNGKNASGQTHYLSLSGFEIYGTVTGVCNDLGMSAMMWNFWNFLLVYWNPQYVYSIFSCISLIVLFCCLVIWNVLVKVTEISNSAFCYCYCQVCGHRVVVSLLYTRLTLVVIC